LNLEIGNVGITVDNDVPGGGSHDEAPHALEAKSPRLDGLDASREREAAAAKQGDY